MGRIRQLVCRSAAQTMAGLCGRQRPAVHAHVLECPRARALRADPRAALRIQRAPRDAESYQESVDVQGVPHLHEPPRAGLHSQCVPVSPSPGVCFAVLLRSVVRVSRPQSCISIATSRGMALSADRSMLPFGARRSEPSRSWTLSNPAGQRATVAFTLSCLGPARRACARTFGTPLATRKRGRADGVRKTPRLLCVPRCSSTCRP
mmetsp:Transcript_75360/g.200379  ORF Transcript_75360/g.200379 Transcript_75360/m.200379 type:complete len:206 (+) Transcript_75360:538-1155(+)